MGVYASDREPTFAHSCEPWLSPACLFPPGDPTMSRRSLTYLVLTIMTYVVAACSSPTAPRNDDPECRGGWQGGSRDCP
jgi:hypothetical protein